MTYGFLLQGLTQNTVFLNSTMKKKLLLLWVLLGQNITQNIETKLIKMSVK